MRTHPFRCMSVGILVLAGMFTLAACSSNDSSQPTTASSSPAEPKLLFEWFEEGASLKSQFTANPDGSDTVVIAGDVAVDTEHVHSDWSPDGTRIAFEALAPDGAAAVWTANADGTGATETIACESENCLQQSFPSWSPDGRSIVFIQGDIAPGADLAAGGDWGPASIVIYNLDNGARTVLAATPDGASAYYSPRWSPDGRHIIAQYETYPDARELAISSSEIVVMPSDRSEPPRSLTDPAMFAGHPDWSPDGELIVFDTYDLSRFFPIAPDDSNLFLMKPDGTELRQLTTTTLADLERVGEPTWSSDGTRIVASVGKLSAADYGINNALIVYVDPQTGEITRAGLAGAQARLQPTSGLVVRDRAMSAAGKPASLQPAALR